MGFNTLQHKWDIAFDIYIRFVTKHHRIPTINGAETQERRLYTWMKRNIEKFKEGSLSEDRVLAIKCMFPALLKTKSCKG